MTANFRRGRVGDLEVVIDAIIEAGAGLIEFMMEDLVPGMPPRRLLSAAVLDPDSPLHFSNAVIAELDGTAVGVALGYPAERFGVPTELVPIVPKRRLEHLRALFANRVEDSYYLHALWVDPAARGLQVGRGLLDETMKVAQENGFTTLSLHVWADNEAALNLYEGYGFEVVVTIPIAPEKHLAHSQGMLLMQLAA